MTKRDDDTQRTHLRALESPVEGDTDALSPAGMRKAWKIYHAGNMKLIESFEYAKEEVRLARIDNARTRIVAYVSAGIVIIAVLIAVIVSSNVSSKMLKAAAETKEIAIKAGEQLTRVERTLSTVVETTAISNEVALEEAVAPTPEPVVLPRGRGSQRPPGASAGLTRPQPPPELVSRRLEAQKRAVKVLVELAGRTNAAEGAQERLVVLEEAVRNQADAGPLRP